MPSTATPVPDGPTGLNLEGRIAVITGAARGIGLATLDRLVAEGASVLAFDLPGAAFEDAMEARHCARVEVFAGDVSSGEDWRKAMDAVLSRFQRLDILFNNAGVSGPVSSLTSYPEAEFDRVMAVNVRGVFLGMQHAARIMKKARSGAIVNNSSIVGFSGGRSIHAYTASKHAVIGLTRAAAVELAPFNVRVNAVCPAPTATEMMFALERHLAPDDPESVRTTMSGGAPMNRYGEPAEVAAAVAYLASDQASFLTGVSLPVDGGMLAR